ncbi:MAG: hypothetical protein ABI772_03900 [Bacteroidota bacterium]
MKYLIFLFVAISFCSSCSQKGYYDFHLVEVYKNDAPAPGKISIIKGPHHGHKYVYQGDSLSVEWYVSKHNYDLTLKNKSRHEIKIVWDSVVQITQKGEVEKLFPDESPFIDKDKSHTAVTVPVLKTHKNTLRLTSNVRFSDVHSYKYSETPHWEEWPIVMEAESRQERKAIASRTVNNIYKLKLPVLVNGQFTCYIFNFKVGRFIHCSTKTILNYDSNR